MGDDPLDRVGALRKLRADPIEALADLRPPFFDGPAEAARERDVVGVRPERLERGGSAVLKLELGGIGLSRASPENLAGGRLPRRWRLCRHRTGVPDAGRAAASKRHRHDDRSRSSTNHAHGAPASWLDVN